MGSLSLAMWVIYGSDQAFVRVLNRLDDLIAYNMTARFSKSIDLP